MRSATLRPADDVRHRIRSRCHPDRETGGDAAVLPRAGVWRTVARRNGPLEACPSFRSSSATTRSTCTRLPCGGTPPSPCEVRSAQPGCGDFCFVWSGSLDELRRMLRDAGAPVEEGPVERVGGRDAGRAKGTSLYTRDPDRNLLEFIVYEPGSSLPGKVATRLDSLAVGRRRFRKGAPSPPMGEGWGEGERQRPRCLSRARMSRMHHRAGPTRAALGAVFVVLAAAAAAQDVPRFEVDPFWPKQLPHDWILGQIGGIAVDANDHIWVFQRPSTLTDEERGAALQPPRSKCCFPAPPVLEFDGEGNLLRAWGGPGEGYEWPAGEHGVSVGSRRQSLARRQRQGGCTAAQVHARRQVPDADRPVGQERGQQQHDDLRASRAGGSRSGDQRAVRRGRVRQPASDSPGRGDRCIQAALGRLRQAVRRTRMPAPTTRTSRSPRSSAHQCIACACRATAWCTYATATTTASRCSSATAASSPSSGSSRAVPRAVRIGLRHRLLGGCAADLPVRGGWRQQRDPHPPAQHGRSAGARRPWRAAGRAVPLAAHDGGRLARQPLHRRGGHRQAHPEVPACALAGGG